MIEVMKQALEFIEATNKGSSFWLVPASQLNKTVTSLRQAIEQAEKQEPFGYFQYAMHFDAWVQNRDSNKGVAFYTTPQPQREWVGLTDKEMLECNMDGDFMIDRETAKRNVEAKLKEKNHG